MCELTQTSTCFHTRWCVRIVAKSQISSFLLYFCLYLLVQPIPEPRARGCLQVEGYWLSQGDMDTALDPSYILTPSVRLNLRDLTRVVAAG